MPTFADGLRAALITDAVLASAREERWVDVAPATREAARGPRRDEARLPHVVHAGAQPRGHRRLGGRERLRGARAGRLAPARRPPVHGEPRPGRRRRRRRRRPSASWAPRRARPRPSRRSRTTTTTSPPTRPSARPYHAHLRACIDAAAALGGVPVGTFIGRDPGTHRRGEPARGRARLPAARRATPASAACA